MSRSDVGHLRPNGASCHRPGLTLAELLVTVAILGALGALVVPQLSARTDDASRSVTLTTLNQARSAVRNYYADMFEQLPYPTDPLRASHPQLAYLYVNPATYGAPGSNGGVAAWAHDAATNRGWAGPYLSAGGRYTVDASAGFTTAFGLAGDPTVVDGWGRPLVLQQPNVASGIYSRTDRRYARLVSAGPNGVIETNETELAPTTFGDDIFLMLGESP